MVAWLFMGSFEEVEEQDLSLLFTAWPRPLERAGPLNSRCTRELVSLSHSCASENGGFGTMMVRKHFLDSGSFATFTQIGVFDFFWSLRGRKCVSEHCGKHVGRMWCTKRWCYDRVYFSVSQHHMPRFLHCLVRVLKIFRRFLKYCTSPGNSESVTPIVLLEFP